MSMEPKVESAQVEELQRRLAQLETELEAGRSAKSLLWAVLENAPDYISRLTPDGTLLFINRLVPGSPHRNIVGRSVFEFVPPEWHDSLRACFERVTVTKAPDRVECVASGGPGRTARYLVRV